MKKGIVLPSLIGLLAVSCSVHELDVKEIPALEDNVFYASLESYSTPETKTYVNEDLNILWDAEDRISIFNRTTLNQAFLFMGETGDNAGYFEQDPDVAVSGTGNPLGVIYAVYPYQASTSVGESGELTLTLPAVQTYREGTFGPGANTMVSVTRDNLLRFKNVGGYLVLKLYGEGISVSSIKLEGHQGEKLSGEAIVTPVIGRDPVISMAETAGTSITLNFDEPVQLNATGDESTLFWLVVPPTHFASGFTLTVTDPHNRVFIKDTNRDLAVTRNDMLRISPIEVVLNSDGLRIDDVYPVATTVKHKTTVVGNTITVTMPTVTDFSNLVLNYDFVGGDVLLADGHEIVPGETPIDATHPVTLTVRNGEQGQSYNLIVRNTGLPVVRITTVGFTRTDIESDAKHETWRPTKDEANYSAIIRVETADGEKVWETNTQIKGRGNASWGYNKRPYALKLVNKQAFFDLPKHKRWILLANWKDRTLLRNDATFWLSQQVSDNPAFQDEELKLNPSFPYTVHGRFVELEFNGEHRGNYYLCEQIKIDSDRLPINEFDAADITGGYLMEIDNNYDEVNKFKSGFYGSSSNPAGLKYMFKDPDEDNITNDAINYMKGYIQSMEALIKKIPKNATSYNTYIADADYGYRAYLDMDSAIWFMFINELTGNGDFFNTDGSSVNDKWYGPHSTYLYKDRDGTAFSKLHMGPVWDFDYKTFISELKTTGWNGRVTTDDRSHKWVGANQQNYYYYYLCKDPAFRSRMLALWNAYKPFITPDLFNDYIDRMAASLILSEEFNTEMWGNSGKDQDQNGDNKLSFLQAVELMKTAFAEKRQFMDENLGTLNQ